MQTDFRFFGMESLEIFPCYDVMKNADIEVDFKHFEAHIDTHFQCIRETKWLVMKGPNKRLS